MVSSFRHYNENIVRISALKFFAAFWRLPGSFLGLSGDLLVSNIINKEAFRKPKEGYKNFQGRNPYNIFVGFLVETMTPKRHFEINWPLVFLDLLILFHAVVISFVDPKFTSFCYWFQLLMRKNGAGTTMIRMKKNLTKRNIWNEQYFQFLSTWLDICKAVQLHGI